MYLLFSFIFVGVVEGVQTSVIELATSIFLRSVVLYGQADSSGNADQEYT